MLNLQRKIERELAGIQQRVEEWQKGTVSPIEAEREIKRVFEKIISYQNAIKKPFPHLYLENKKEIKALYSKLYPLYREVFQLLQHKYLFKMSFEELIMKYKDDITLSGLSAAIQKERLIEKAFHSCYQSLLPNHPKDEYPLARSLKRKFYIHSGPTNSGKTYNALNRLKESKSGVYLAPLRLLAAEVYEKLNIEGTPCTLKTGEEEVNVPSSHHISSTIEKADLETLYEVAVAVIDEGQLIGDKDRGDAWTRAVLGLYAQEIHICCSINVVPLLKKIIHDCEDELYIIDHKRKTPLVVESDEFEFPKDICNGDALIVFSRKSALKTYSYLRKLGIKCSVIYGDLPPISRRKQVNQFLDGSTDVIIATDAIGMGMNLPVKRVVFLEIEKFDGEEQRDLYDQEVKQIAGRAGRQGIYPQGFVNAAGSKEEIRKQIYKSDDLVTYAYIAPTKDVLVSLGIGTIKERLQYWPSLPSSVPYINRAELKDPLRLLERLEEKDIQEISEVKLCQVIYIPVDTHNELLVDLWYKYVKQTIESVTQYTQPHIDLNDTLESLELKYKELDIYYLFNKTFNKVVNIEWINQCREDISVAIYNRLENEI